MFNGYTRVLFTLDGNDKGLRGHSKKICKPRFNTDRPIRKYFFLKSSDRQMEQFGPGHLHTYIHTYCWCTQPELFQK